MSSREIAELTGKKHNNVKRDIDKMCSELNRSDLSSSEYEHRGNVYTQYHLDKELTLCLVSWYSTPLRMKIIKRLDELENDKFKIPQTYSEALQLCADQAKKIELDAPKVTFVEKLVERETLMTATQVAQKHKKSAVWLNKFLDEVNVYSKAVKRSRVFQQWFIDKGFGEMKQTELGCSQALFTPSGELWISEKIYSEGAL